MRSQCDCHLSDFVNYYRLRGKEGFCALAFDLKAQALCHHIAVFYGPSCGKNHQLQPKWMEALQKTGKKKEEKEKKRMMRSNRILLEHMATMMEAGRPNQGNRCLGFGLTYLLSGMTRFPPILSILLF